MTNAYQPLQGLPGFGGGAPAPLQGLPGFAAPQQVAQPGGPVGTVLPAALQGTGQAEFDAARPVADVGVLQTVATQAGRGLLDAALGSGAVLGAGAEGLGTLTDWDGLKDFGRDLGRSSNGAAAMEAASFLFGKGTGGNQQGLTYAEKADRAIAEQEKAWPMLTAVSRIGGGIGLAVATGGGATAGAAGTLRGALGIAAYEGAASGMQQAYSQNESLRDVLVSGVTGAAFAAGTVGVLHGAASLPGKLASSLEKSVEGSPAHGFGQSLADVFGRAKTAADDVAETIRNAGGSEMADAAKAVLKERAEVLRQVTEAGENPTLIRQAYEAATDAASKKLSKLAGGYDVANWADKAPTPLQKLLHRTPILDQVSADLAEDVGSLGAARPSIDFGLRVPGKLLADADKTAAIGGLQTRLTEALEQVPDGRLRGLLIPASEQLAKADAAGSMAIGHDLVKELSAVARATDIDGVTASYARRQAQALADELGGDAWGSAGKAYKALTRLDSPLEQLDQKIIRAALQNADSSNELPAMFAEHNAQMAAAFEARKTLGGPALDAPTKKLLAETLERAQTAQKVATFDGAPAKRVLDIVSGAGKNIAESYGTDLLSKGVAMGVGLHLGGIPGMLVARALSPVLGEITGAAFGKLGINTSRAAGARFAAGAAEFGAGARRVGAEAAKRTAIWQQHDYQSNINALAQMVTGATPEASAQQQAALATVPPEVQSQAGADMQQKLTQLMADIPKPTPNIRGKAWETLSSGDLRKAQAMFEATVKPMSVFSDFTRGDVDYDKVRYAWKQYPGLKQAAQAGLVDILHSQLDDKQRAGISDGMLTQLDNLFGFDGTLQGTLDHGFSQRMSALAQPEQPNPKPQSSGPLKLPGSQPSYTERIAGART